MCFGSGPAWSYALTNVTPFSSLVTCRGVKGFTVALHSGNTTALSSTGTKFLGSLVADSWKSTLTLASSTLLQRFSSSLKLLDSRPVPEESTSYGSTNISPSSFHFHLAVNLTTTSIKKMEAASTKLIKKWWKLPRNATQAILYHPDVLKVPRGRLKSRSWLPFFSSLIRCWGNSRSFFRNPTILPGFLLYYL